MVTETSAVAGVLVMVLVTFATRVAGVWREEESELEWVSVVHFGCCGDAV